MTERPARLLIAEDNKVNRLLMQRSLQQLGHEVFLAENGRVALDMMRRDTYDLLLLDIEMPEMNGFEVLEVLTADPQLRDVPVIVVSAVDGMDSVVRCIEHGADDYLHKPISPVLLKARIGASLEKKRLRDRMRELVRCFATREVADELVNSGFTLGGQRVQATVMFSDIRGFTAMSEQMPPEEAIDLLNTYYALMFEAITSHGGIVNQMIGDGLMAVFGAPMPLADPCGSAVRAAREMVDMIEQFNQQPDRADKQPIHIGIGIASGSVIAGYTGTDQRATYTCVGNTVNLASRLEAHTKMAGHPILIDSDTQAALTDQAGIKALGPVLFRGKSLPVPVFAVA